MRQHVHKAVESHQCDLCGATLRRRDTLQRHMLIHTNAKPFVCNLCGNAFNCKEYLNVRSRVFYFIFFLEHSLTCAILSFVRFRRIICASITVISDTHAPCVTIAQCAARMSTNICFRSIKRRIIQKEAAEALGSSRRRWNSYGSTLLYAN